MKNDDLEVTQADRDAARNWYGNTDHPHFSVMVRFLARHRLSTRDDGLREALVREALDETRRRYPETEDALLFFACASGLEAGSISSEAEEWAKEALPSPQPEQSAPAGEGEVERAREYVASSMHDRDKSWGDLVRAGERDDCPEMRMVLKAMRTEALRTQSQPVLTDEVVEQSNIDRFTGRPIGDHGTAYSAIRFAMECEHDLANRDAFLRAWTDGDLTEWPEYYGWLENVEPVAALASMGEGE